MKAIDNKQSGFIVLMGMLILVLGAAAWFGTVSSLRSESMSIDTREEHIRELQRIKQRMLTYAVMQPEIFRTDSGSTAVRAQENIPGPGYFPCPDTNGDGDSNSPCGGGGVDFVMGMVPESTSARFFSFIDKPGEARSYWYAVDARYVTQNTDYTYDGSVRRFPLNRNSPATANLTLDGVNDIVMVLFYAGDQIGSQNQSSLSAVNFLELENSDNDADFISVFNDPDRFNDYVIPITRNEWNATVLSRVSKDVMTGVTVGTVGDNVPDLCDLVATNDLHWFNDCLYTGAAPPFACTLNTTSTDQNLMGQGWRSDLGC